MKILCVVILTIFIALYSAAEELSLVVTGDIMLGRYIDLDYEQNKSDPFEKISAILSNSDITLGNLECSLARDPKKLKPVLTGYVFRSDEAYGKLLKGAKFDSLTIANNHALGGGNTAVFKTIEVLDGMGIVHFGGGANLAEAKKYKIIERKGVRVGFLGTTMECPDTYPAGENSPGVYKCSEVSIIEDIKEAKKYCDLLVVSIHWGKEKTLELTPVQIRLARKMIEEGADAVIGNHPHVIQGFELYKGKFIVYSLGNLVFDNLNKSANTDKGVILRLSYESLSKELKTVEAYPVILKYKKFYPVPADKTEKKVISALITEASKIADKNLNIMKILVIK